MKPGSGYCLDMSTWVSGPTTAVGLCAINLGREIIAACSANGVAVEIFSRRALGVEKKILLNRLLNAPGSLKFAPFYRRWFAKFVGQVFISFDHRLVPVCGARRVAVIHDAWTLRQNPWQSLAFQNKQRPKILKALSSADVIVCPSQTVAQELAPFARSSACRIRVLPWAAMVSGTLKPSSSESQTLVVVGTFESRKNHALMFRLATLLGPKWRWIFVGAEGHGAASGLAIVRELDSRGYKIQHLQKLSESELFDVYREAFAVICPSFEEGFGLTVLEALKLGRPVWASGISTHREIGAESLPYFDPQGSDVEKVAQEIINMSRNAFAYQNQIVAGQQRARQFSWSQCGKNFLELIS